MNARVLADRCPATFSVDRWVICIGGFTQQIGEQTGTHRLWMRLRLQVGDGAQVEFYQWNTAWRDVANLIVNSRGEFPPRIDIVAYSWGAGWGFVSLANLLAERGLVIDTATLCDPVYRSRWMSFRWRSIFGRPTIDVPRNVRRVWCVYQRTDWPIHGHDLRLEDPANTSVVRAVCLSGVQHESMDEQFTFYEMAMEAVR